MRNLFIQLLFCSSVFIVNAQQVASFFIIAPENVIPQIETNRRKDMIDYYRANTTNGSPNRWGGMSKVQSLDDNFLEISLSKSSSMQMKLFTANDSNTVIAIINTVQTPSKDSRITFYDTLWNKLDARKLFPLQANIQFIQSNDSCRSVAKKIDMWPTELSFSPKEDKLFTSHSLDQYLLDQQWTEVQNCLINTPLVWLWKNGKFEIQSSK